MYLAWKAMGGQMPRLEPHLLPDMSAQRAFNVVLWRGGVEPLHGETFTARTYKGGEKMTIYRDGQNIDSDTKYWFSFTTDVDITRGPVVDDDLGRLFFTGNGVPKVTWGNVGWSDPGPMPNISYNLGVPAPAGAAAVAINSGGTVAEDAVPVTILVAYSFVTADGYVGAPSPVSQPLSYLDGSILSVQQIDNAPSGAYNMAKKNIYIAITDSTGATALRFWRSIGLFETFTNGVVDFNTLGEEVDSPSLLPPPDDMFGLMLHPNGFMVAFTKRKFLRSEVFKPYGWPDAYQDPIGPDIVGGAIIGQQTIICTKGKTFSAIGADPLNQQINDLAGNLPCTAKRSIKALPFGVLYSSPDGLVLAGGDMPLLLVSDGFFTRKQWQAYKPESMHAVVHDNNYTIFWKIDATMKGSIIFEFEPNGRILRVTESHLWFSAAYNDNRRDEMFVAGADGEIYKWGAGDPLTALWRSKELRLNRPQNIGAVRIMAEEYPVTFRLYDMRRIDNKIEKVLISQVEVTSDRPERLQGRDRCTTIHWEVESTTKWTQLELGSSVHSILAQSG